MSEEPTQFKTGSYHGVPDGVMRVDNYNRRIEIKLEYKCHINTGFEFEIKRNGLLGETTEKHSVGAEGNIRIRPKITSGVNTDYRANIINAKYFAGEMYGATTRPVGGEIMTFQLNKNQVAAYANEHFPHMCLEGELDIAAIPTLPGDVDLAVITREVLKRMDVRQLSRAHKAYFDTFDTRVEE